MLGGIYYKYRCIIHVQDNLSLLLKAINCLFLIMAKLFNITLIIQLTLKYFFSKSLSIKTFLKLNEYLRSLKNSYHILLEISFQAQYGLCVEKRKHPTSNG